MFYIIISSNSSKWYSRKILINTNWNAKRLTSCVFARGGLSSRMTDVEAVSGMMYIEPICFDTYMEVFIRVLTEKFPRGYRLGSSLEMKKFRHYYESMNGVALKMEQEMAEILIRKCGIVHDGRVYMPQTMASGELKEKLFSYIDNNIAKGKTAIYFEALFQEFSDEFLDYNMYDADMLRAYIAYFVDGRYFIERNYLTKERRIIVDPIDDVRRCLKERGMPIAVEELCLILSHIPEDKIKFLLRSNGEFVRNRKGEYFHADSFSVTEEELENISSLIQSEIEVHEFISGNELYDDIRKKYPYIYEKNTIFSVIGWRDALKYKMGDQFSFSGNVISNKDANLTMRDVFASFARERQCFTITELLSFAESMGSTIYFDALYKNVARISQEQFIRKDNVHFQIEETDKILDRFCEGDYVPLTRIKDFGLFPDASHPWTVFLLEQYLVSYSERYYLIHGGYNRNVVVGAMVKKKCTFKDFDDLVTDILATSDVVLQKKAALNYLADNGYIARRSYINIESLLINARARRNKKEN